MCTNNRITWNDISCQFFFVKNTDYSDFCIAFLNSISVVAVSVFMWLNVLVCKCTHEHIHSYASQPRELTERTWQCSYLPHIAVWLTALPGSTVIRGKKTFHISVSPTVFLRASQQGPTHSPLLSSPSPFPPPFSLALCCSYSPLCFCLAPSDTDLMSGVLSLC